MCRHKKIEVVAGAHLINEDEKTQVRQISTDFFAHPDYDAANIRNDVALIHLSEPLTFNGMEQLLICVPLTLKIS